MANTSSNAEHFFETDAAQAQRARRAGKAANKLGNPIALKSKILGAVPDPRSPSSAVLVAESAGAVRRVDVDDGSTGVVYRGPTTPVSCLCTSTSSASGSDSGSATGTLFAGAWDKCIWSWDLATRKPGRKYVGHADFVKAVTCARIGGRECLISGGSDKKILVWDVATGKVLHTLQDGVVAMLAVQHLAIDPVSSTSDAVYLVSASSDPHVRRWRVALDAWEQVSVSVDDTSPEQPHRTLLEHETSVYRVVFDVEGDEVDLWTASGDGTAKCLTRAGGFACDDTLAHGDHVRAVAVTDQWVVTAGRDEDVRVWDRATGTLYCALEGHFDEITDLVVLRGQRRVCSVSIDGTVRTWPLDKGGLDAAVAEQQRLAAGEDEGEGETGAQEDPEQMLTADEEAELAELLDDDDD